MKITLKQLLDNVNNGVHKALYMSGSIASELQKEIGLEDYVGADDYIEKDCILYRVNNQDVAIFTRGGKYLAIWHSFCDDGLGCLCSRGYLQYLMMNHISEYQIKLEKLFIDQSYQTEKFVQLVDDSVLNLYGEED